MIQPIYLIGGSNKIQWLRIYTDFDLPILSKQVLV